MRAQLQEALTRLSQTLPLHVPVMIGAGERANGELLSTDPGEPDSVIAVAARATEGRRRRRSRGGRTRVPRVAGRQRATTARQRFIRAAAWLRERRLEIAALEVRECAKPWPEADADVCEAIDFLEYYARGAIELEAGPKLLQVPGERNDMSYGPRGVVAVVAPWNFPLAIPCGMTLGGARDGQRGRPQAGRAVAGLCADAGPGAPHRRRARPRRSRCCPGKGDAGAALVSHPGVHTIAFTGSMPVDVEIARAAAEVVPGQRHLKRVVSDSEARTA